MKKISVARLNELIDEIATFDLEDGRVFGSSYLVMQDGKVIFKKLCQSLVMLALRTRDICH